MARGKSGDPFYDVLKDLLKKVRENRPKGSVPYGTIVRSAKIPNMWGVIFEAQIMGNDTVGTPIICYSVSWNKPAPKPGSRSSPIGIFDQPLMTVEAEYNLIYVLFPPKNPGSEPI